MGAVFRATHLAMEKKVAVKLLKPHLTSDEAALQRFAREARSTLKVDSPHAVKVLDYGVTPGRDYYMVLEYLDGRTVQRELDVDGVFAPARAVHVARQALHALGAAHAMGLIHRDIKPDNVLLMRHGSDGDFTKLLDFGVAKLMEGAAKSQQSKLALTQAGTVFGTPEFMSPEQACGHPLDGRSDLYSLAATVFAMLTGSGLFEAASPIEWLTHHVRTPPPRLADVRPELVAYPELDELLQRCLAKSRDDRPASAAALDALFAKLEPAFVERRPGIAPSPSRTVKVFSTSSYVEALPAATGPQSPTNETAEVEARPPPSRGLALAAIVIVALAAAALVGGLALSRQGRKPDELARAPVPAPPPVTATPPPIVDAAPGIDAPVAPPDAAVLAPRPTPPAPQAPNAHLVAAEAALRAGNHLKQMAEAQLALEAAPRSARARYLLGDALIKYGNLERGCSYLAQLGPDRLAVARRRAAGCE
jgi:eukaryotic-like serine/threonine-protein kinase